MKIIEPANALVEFLTTKIPEPIREYKGTQYVNRLTSITSESQTGDGSTKFFTVTNTPLVSITSVSVNAVDQVKYKDFDIDIERNSIFFNTAPTSGHIILISYKYRTSASTIGTWIFPDKPRLDLRAESYPRISVVQINNPAEMRGWNSSVYWNDSISLQVDTIVKKKVLCSVDFVQHAIDTDNGGVQDIDIQLSE